MPPFGGATHSILRQLWVATTNSSCAEAVAGTANFLASSLRQLRLYQQPFAPAPVEEPNGRLVLVSVSTPAGDQRQQPLPQSGTTHA